ncbi:MAG: M48 family metallopeptidase [Desulfobulbaceae bacterium]|nr:M48 family metallopeptidase [Desulfobulbaceae bacterium]
MKAWLFAVLFIIIISYFLELIISLLNLKALNPDLPNEFKSIYNKDDYRKSQNYTRATTSFSIVESSCTTVLTIVFLIFGGFNYVDIWARSFGFGTIITGLIFTAALSILAFLASLPFSVYSTFVIEEKFGFNRTTITTYVLDLLKGTCLATLIGGPLLALIFWFFIYAGPMAWLYCWIGLVIFSIVMQYLAPVFIMPIFNKFTPLENNSLRQKIFKYAESQNFKIQGIFTMDGSKRSSKLNAFFTGFGKFRKIVFFDTLVEKLNEDEIVAVLAHEMGHFKLNHIFKMMAASVLQTGFMFYLLSLFLTIEDISTAFGLSHNSVYSSLIFFGFLFTPINILVSIVFNVFSRRHEYQADSYAASSTEGTEFLISSLKKLSQANLSNLTPHPLNVFIHYSHPPLLKRIAKLQSIGEF